MAKINYQKTLERTIESVKGSAPELLLHACCAPCSSYCLEYLSGYFDITLFYFNPNITDPDEYSRRVNEVKRLIAEMNLKSVKFIEGDRSPDRFFEFSKGFENEKEGGKRCELCYRLRLTETAKLAKVRNFDYFTTTLTISPYKNADKLNEIGKKLSEQYGIKYLYSDFKKNNGYKRSIELSKKYDLYRQNYCGCVYSKLLSESKK